MWLRPLDGWEISWNAFVRDSPVETAFEGDKEGDIFWEARKTLPEAAPRGSGETLQEAAGKTGQEATLWSAVKTHQKITPGVPAKLAG